MRDDDNDDHALLATLAVKVARLEAEVDRLETRFTLLARFIPIEKATMGLIALVAASLVGYAMARLFGGAPMSQTPIGRFWLALPWVLLALGLPTLLWWTFEPVPVRVTYVAPHFLSRPAINREDADRASVLAITGGSTLFRYVEYCVDSPFEGTSHRSWVGKALVWHAPDLPTVMSRVPGCFAANMAVDVPASSPTRTFSFVQSMSIVLNPLRTERIQYAPIPLTILDSKD